MTVGPGIEGDYEQALQSVGVPAYVIDTTGIVRWINPAAVRLLGDIRGRHFTSVIAPEDRPGARDRFTQKMLGTAPTSEATGHLVPTAGHGCQSRSARCSSRTVNGLSASSG